MGEWLEGLPPEYREAAELCLELGGLDPAALTTINEKLRELVTYLKRRTTDEFSPESLVARTYCGPSPGDYVS